MTQPVNYVVDMDIAKFFDTVGGSYLPDGMPEPATSK